MQRTAAIIAATVLPLAFAACGSKPEPPPDPNGKGAMVIGLTSDLRPGVDVQKVHVEITAGELRADKDLLGADIKFPSEFPLDSLDPGEKVSVLAEAYYENLPTPIVTRTVHTSAIANKKLLLKVPLDSRCALSNTSPICNAPETCIAGACANDAIDPKTLPDYTPDWGAVGDVCKPVNHGAPTVVVGQGESAYLPMMDGDVAQVEAGPQGGHHVWVAIRQKNLKQSGTVTTLTAKIPDLGVEIEPFAVVFTFDPDEGGYCKLYGLRFQLDLSHDIHDFLGHSMEITATATDAQGDVGIGKRTVMLSSTILEP